MKTTGDQSPESHLQVYLVGGAVRDRIMGIKNQDRDWVVVGTDPEKMIELGFKPVGKHFPVFLHPKTKEEYALARTEKKIARGYHGFQFNSSPDVTLEEDLARRDLTMNAMAMDRNGAVVDPFNGTKDIQRKIIRHVGCAFSEDPVRLLRVARFAARYDYLDFQIHPRTYQQMRKMVRQGEVDALMSERVWKELVACFNQGRISRFMQELKACGALEKVLPEVHALFGVPQVKKYHPEVDAGLHTLLALDRAQELTKDPEVLFAVLTHDLGKAMTPKEQWPNHRGHELAGLEPLEKLCNRLGVPKSFSLLAQRVCRWHLHHHRIEELKPKTVLKLLQTIDVFRKPGNLDKFCMSCLADKRGRIGFEKQQDKQSVLLEQYYRATLKVNVKEIAETTFQENTNAVNSGQVIKQKIYSQRIKAITEVMQSKKTI